MIEYEGVYKIFGKGENAVTAVENVSFRVEKGELVTLLGPSGCGKTTLLRLTNRLIGLTRGKIIVDGRNINDVNPVKLRQSMGYAIQAIGLFPNKTIYGNIATVPRLLKWDEKRISRRVDELLSMLRLDPERFRDRYPPELSGGQQQRVGVARCLAADPEILLMDEPFGAIDPINRVEIQDEFLRVQDELKKTILFVTHDIQEAIKMGDKIAIFEKGKLVQYDAPDTILIKPKNDYIADFVGADRGLKVLGLREIRHAFDPDPENLLKGDTKASNALKELLDKGFDHGIVVKNGKPVGYVKTSALENRQTPVQELAEPYPKCVAKRDNLKDVMSLMFMHDIEHLCVVDDDGNFEGAISLQDIQKTIMEIYAKKEKKEK